MKKQILAALSVAMLGAVALTGCQKEKPYTLYQIGTRFSVPTQPADDKRSPEEWQQSLSIEEQEQLRVGNYIAGWLISNGYVRTRSNNPITLEGDDIVGQDQQAYNMYQNLVKALNKEDLAQLVVDAQKESDPSKQIELTRSGSVSFDYLITGISTLAPAEYPQSTGYTVSYGPLSANPEGAE